MPEVEGARAFATPAALAKWLAANHAKRDALWVLFYKVGSGKSSITWPQSVDEALRYGWIDGLRKRVDDESYAIRFSPRKATSHWSAVNVKRVAELTKAGRMTQAGLDAFAKRRVERTARASHERKGPIPLDAATRKALRADAKAWVFWKVQPPHYHKLVGHWLESAKREETRERRRARLLADSRAGKRVSDFRPRQRRPVA